AFSAAGGAVFQFRQKQNERGDVVNIPGYEPPCWLKLTRRRPGLLARTEIARPVPQGRKVDVTGRIVWEQGQPVLLEARFAEVTPKTNPPLAVQPAAALTRAVSETICVPIGRLI